MINAALITTLALQALGGVGVVTRDPSPTHPGVDVSCVAGAPIYATQNGALYTSWSHTHGLTAIIHQPAGPIHSFSHLQSSTRNRYVQKGERIGSCGSTGSYSTGPHLHFELIP